MANPNNFYLFIYLLLLLFFKENAKLLLLIKMEKYFVLLALSHFAPPYTGFLLGIYIYIYILLFQNAFSILLPMSVLFHSYLYPIND